MLAAKWHSTWTLEATDGYFTLQHVLNDDQIATKLDVSVASTCERNRVRTETRPER